MSGGAPKPRLSSHPPFSKDYFWLFWMRFLTFWRNSLESNLTLGMTWGVFFF